MSERAENGLDSGRYNFVADIGWVPSGPRSDIRYNMRLELEEGETLEAASSSRLSNYSSTYSESGNRSLNYSREASQHSSRYQFRNESLSSVGSRGWIQRDSRGLHEWPRSRARHGYRSTPGVESPDKHYPSQSQSRSRSPGWRRGHSQDVFIWNEDIETDRGDSPAPSRALSLDPPAPIYPYQSQSPCRCPTSDRCCCRPRGSHDCRRLVPIPLQRTKGRPQEYATIARPPRRLSVPAQRISATLKKFKDHLKRLRGQNPRRSQIQEEMKDWLIRVQEIGFVITPEILGDSGVLLSLEQFCSDELQAWRNALEITPTLVEDLTYTFRKWRSGDLDNHPDRGLLSQRSERGDCRQILDEDWPHRKNGSYYGAGDLVTGQRWPSRLHMRRDGAHNPPEAGISGSTKTGAWSVVMGLHNLPKNRVYADRDMGEEVRYMGTGRKKGESSNRDRNLELAEENSDKEGDEEGAEDRPTIHTRMLMKSAETKNPIRFFRSSKFSDTSPYTPVEGYRYDGLYIVHSHTLLDKESQIYRFNMHRIPGQPPIREYDDRTFELTPEIMARVAKRKEERRQNSESMGQAI